MSTYRIEKLCQLLLFLLGLTVPLVQCPGIPVGNHWGLNLQFFDGIACLAAPVAVCLFWTTKTSKSLRPLIYPISLCVSVCFSAHPGGSIGPLARALYLAGLACTVRVLLDHSKDSGVKSLRLGWLFGLSLVCLSILLGVLFFYCGYKTQQNNMFLFHYGSIEAGNFPRVCGTFLNANLLCNYLLVSLGWIRDKRWSGLIVGLALATLSPGLGPLALFFLWSFRTRPWKVIGLGVALLAYLLTWTYPNDALRGQFRINSARVECWKEAGSLWMQSPLVGKGPGQANFMVAWRDANGQSSVLTDPHNTMLSLLSQGGILTLCAVLGLFLRKRDAQNQPLLLAANLALWLDGLTGSFEDARHIWLALGAFSSRPEKAAP